MALGKRLGVPQALGISTDEWVENRLGGYVRMSITERREAVKELTAPPEEGGQGLSTREAAEVLSVDQSTIVRSKGDANASVGTTEPDRKQPDGDANASVGTDEPGAAPPLSLATPEVEQPLSDTFPAPELPPGPHPVVFTEEAIDQIQAAQRRRLRGTAIAS